MLVDFNASQPHYLDHIAPIWQELTPKERGTFSVADRLRPLAEWYGIDLTVGPHRGDVLVAAGTDDCTTYGHRLVFVEHGIGQTYSDRHPAYAGGLNRDTVALFLAPNERVWNRNKLYYPNAEHALVGSPRLDRLRSFPKPRGDRVAMSFHWPCDLWPEAGSAWLWAREEVKRLAEYWRLLGHEHPRWEGELAAWWRAVGVPFASHFDTVAKQAAVYVCDNSSTLYEFAALDRPVVVLNPPQYRRQVDHGLRFWDMADVGVQVDDINDLDDALELALDDRPEQADRRREICEELFPFYDGRSAIRAADAIRALG